MNCISFAAWMPHALLAVLGIGMATGFSLKFGLDYAELTAYRRVARLPPEGMR